MNALVNGSNAGTLGDEEDQSDMLSIQEHHKWVNGIEVMSPDDSVQAPFRIIYNSRAGCAGKSKQSSMECHSLCH